MAILEVITYGHPVLEKQGEDINEITDEIRQLAGDMIYTMYAQGGIGLAAPQVNVSKRLLVIDIDQKDTNAQAMVFINPEIISSSEEKESYKEGCLSFPDIEADIVRPKKIRARWMDLEGKTYEEDIDGLLARVLQHEVDHTNGIVFINRMNRLKRTTLAPKLNRLKKESIKKFGIKK